MEQFKNNPKAIEYIDEKCQEIQFVKLRYSEVKEGLKFPQVSYKCRRVLEEKEKVLKHIVLEDSPEKEIQEFLQR